MKKLILLVTLLVGCGGEAPNLEQKQSCVAICDSSLNNCVKVLGEENKLECHRTYDGVCMPGCHKGQ